MTEENKEINKLDMINDVLVELENKIGYDDKNNEHFNAHQIALQSLINIVSTPLSSSESDKKE